MGFGTFDSEGAKEARTDLTHSRSRQRRPLTVDAATCTSNSDLIHPPRAAVPRPRTFDDYASAGPLTRQRQRLAVGDTLPQPLGGLLRPGDRGPAAHGVGAALPSHVEGLPVLTARAPSAERTVTDRKRASPPPLGRGAS